MSCNDRCGESLVFLLVGGLIGAGIALLYAPKTGRETREDISKLASKGAERVVDEKGVVQQRLSDYLSLISGKTEELIHGGVKLADDKKEELLSAIKAAKRAFDEERQRFEEEQENI